MYKTTSKKILDTIDRADQILLVAHSKPDGDTLGATLAFAHLLEGRGKQFDMYCEDEPATYFTYLPKINHFTRHKDAIDLKNYKAIICLDHGAIHMSGLGKELAEIRDNHHDIAVINIDHHISNDNFANINLVRPECSSTCEVLYDMFSDHNLPVAKNTATCLMTGLITDTGNFTNAATTQRSLIAASDLIRKGAKIPRITQYVFNNKNINALKLWGEVLSRIRVNPTYKIAYTIILPDDFDRYGVTDDALDGLVNFLQGVDDDIHAVLLLVQKPGGKIKGSLRTTKKNIDVSKLAAQFGGGGHPGAAGFMIDGNLCQMDEKWRVI